MPPLCAVVCDIVNTTLFITLPTKSAMGVRRRELAPWDEEYILVLLGRVLVLLHGFELWCLDKPS